MKTSLDFLERIAMALERQVQQHEEAVKRGLELRLDNIRRSDQQRDEELAITKGDNAELIHRLDAALEQMAHVRVVTQSLSDRVAALESAESQP